MPDHGDHQQTCANCGQAVFTSKDAAHLQNGRWLCQAKGGPRWEDWLREVKRLAVDHYEWTRANAESHFKFENMWVYFSTGNTPEEAVKAERDA